MLSYSLLLVVIGFKPSSKTNHDCGISVDHPSLLHTPCTTKTFLSIQSINVFYYEVWIFFVFPNQFFLSIQSIDVFYYEVWIFFVFPNQFFFVNSIYQCVLL
jgi:hypothetical protein